MKLVRIFSTFVLIGMISNSFTTPAHAIVGGTTVPTDPGSNPPTQSLDPWMGTLETSTGGVPDPTTNTCGVTLVGARFAITSAHCVNVATSSYGANAPLFVTIGGYNLSPGQQSGQSVQVSSVIQDPNFNATTLTHDFALLVLSKNVTQVQVPIYVTQQEIAGGKTATIIGWGETGTNLPTATLLQQAQVNTIDRATCSAALTGIGVQTFNATTICAGVAGGTKDACTSDSGGPLFVIGKNGRPVQIGITSWGAPCGTSSLPGAYTNLAAELGFLLDQLGGQTVVKLADYALTGDQLKVAQIFDTIGAAAPAGSSLQQDYGRLFMNGVGGTAASLQSLLPTSAFEMGGAVDSFSAMQTSDIMARVRSLREGTAGGAFDVTGLRFNNASADRITNVASSESLSGNMSGMNGSYDINSMGLGQSAAVANGSVNSDRMYNPALYADSAAVTTNAPSNAQVGYGYDAVPPSRVTPEGIGTDNGGMVGANYGAVAPLRLTNTLNANGVGGGYDVNGNPIRTQVGTSYYPGYVAAGAAPSQQANNVYVPTLAQPLQPYGQAPAQYAAQPTEASPYAPVAGMFGARSVEETQPGLPRNATTLNDQKPVVAAMGYNPYLGQQPLTNSIQPNGLPYGTPAFRYVQPPKPQQTSSTGGILGWVDGLFGGKRVEDQPQPGLPRTASTIGQNNAPSGYAGQPLGAYTQQMAQGGNNPYAVYQPQMMAQANTQGGQGSTAQVNLNSQYGALAPAFVTTDASSMPQSADQTYTAPYAVATNQVPPRLGTVAIPYTNTPPTTINADRRWGIFMSGDVRFGGEHLLRNSDQTAIDNSGFSVGVDYRVVDKSFIGMALSYAHASFNTGNFSDVQGDGYAVSLYGTTSYMQNAYLDGFMSFGYHTFDSERTLLIGNGQTLTANASPDAWHFSANAETGYNFKQAAWKYGPFAGMKVLYANYNNYTESGGGNFDLNVHARDTTSVIGNLGMAASHSYVMSNGGVLVPSLRAAYNHEFGDGQYNVTSNFVSATNMPFVTEGAKLERDWMSLQPSISAALTNNWLFQAYYEHDFFRYNVDDHIFNLAARYKW